MYLAARVKQAEQHFISLLGEDEGIDAKAQQNLWEVRSRRYRRREKVGNRSRVTWWVGHLAGEIFLSSADTEQKTKR